MKKYGIIYADPPWAYRNKHCEGSALAHYNTMRLEDICNLPVKKIAAQDCVLFLWTTYPMLPEALRVIEAWGFKYKTIGFAWIKQNRKADSLYMGTGYWTRANSEVCLLAIKGKPKRISASVHSVIVSHIREHSKKPDEARQRIVELMGDLPRIELFARQKADGGMYGATKLIVISNLRRLEHESTYSLRGIAKGMLCVP